MKSVVSIFTSSAQASQNTIVQVTFIFSLYTHLCTQMTHVLLYWFYWLQCSPALLALSFIIDTLQLLLASNVRSTVYCAMLPDHHILPWILSNPFIAKGLYKTRTRLLVLFNSCHRTVVCCLASRCHEFDLIRVFPWIWLSLKVVKWILSHLLKAILSAKVVIC